MIPSVVEVVAERAVIVAAEATAKAEDAQKRSAAESAGNVVDAAAKFSRIYIQETRYAQASSSQTMAEQHNNNNNT